MRMTAQWAHSCWPSRHQLCYVQVRSLCDMVFTLRISQRCAAAYRTNSTHEQGYLLGVEFSIPKWWWGRQGVNIIWHLQNITYKWRVIWNISETCNSLNRSLALFTHQTRKPFLCAWLRRARQSHLVEKREKCAFWGRQETYSRKYFHYRVMLVVWQLVMLT